MKRPLTIYTVGHSTHTIEKFLNLLERNGVNAIADVRSHPFSRTNPQFNKDTIAAELKKRGIAYVFVGKELGARPDDRSCYEGGKVRYALIAKTSLFKMGIERVLSGAQKYRVALMCSEKEPLNCHRTLLVSRALEERGVAVVHILEDGSTESQEQTMLRLVDQEGLRQLDLFHSYNKSRIEHELVDMACEKREKRIAYIDQ